MQAEQVQNRLLLLPNYYCMTLAEANINRNLVLKKKEGKEKRKEERRKRKGERRKTKGERKLF